MPALSSARPTSATRAASRSSASSERQAQAQEPRVPALEPPLLEEVEERDGGGDGEARERGEHQADVHVERPPGPVGVVDAGAAARPREHEQRRRDGHHPEPEQPVAGIAAPGEVPGDDEPGEEVQRARPGAPREAVGRRGLRDEQRRLRQPADPNAPDPEPAVAARTPQPAGVRERGLAVGEQRGPDEQLSHRPARPSSRARASRASSPVSRSSRESFVAMIAAQTRTKTRKTP